MQTSQSRLALWAQLTWGAAGLLALIILLLGREYLNDDVPFLLANPDIGRIRTFGDCFHFTFQPTKPVFNFFMALGVYLSSAAVRGQRVLSLVLHLLNVGLLLVLLRRTIFRDAPRSAFFSTLVFSILPIHLETLGIGQFRGEIIGTSGLLVAMIIAQHEAKLSIATGVALFLLGGLTFLSKEVLGVLLALLLSYQYRLFSTPLRRWKAAQWTVLALGVFWTSVTVALYQVDKVAMYSYRGNVGWGVLPFTEHGSLALRALFEGAHKLFTGLGLSSVRLRDRADVLAFLPLSVKALVLASLAIGSLRLAWRNTSLRLWLLWAWMPALLYVGIPNVNIGAEHYWYTASIGAVVCLMALTARWEKWHTLGWGAYAALLIIITSSRAFDFETRLAFYHSEWELHPEAASTWLNYASALSEKGEGLKVTLPLFTHARAIWPENPELASFEFSLYAKAKQVEALPPLLKRIERAQKISPRTLSQFYLQTSVLFAEKGACPQALAAAKEAHHWDPANAWIQRTVARFPCTSS